jgi:hypothetical protein
LIIVAVEAGIPQSGLQKPLCFFAPGWDFPFLQKKMAD